MPRIQSSQALHLNRLFSSPSPCKQPPSQISQGPIYIPHLKSPRIGLEIDQIRAHIRRPRKYVEIPLRYVGKHKKKKKTAHRACRGVGSTQGCGPLWCFISSCLCTTITLSAELRISRSWTLRKALEVMNLYTLRTVPSYVIL